MKKRVISILMAVLLLMSSGIAIHAETGSASDEFEFLSVVGFGLDLTDPDKVLTRIELAQLAINLKGVALIEDAEAVCHDIYEKHWAFPYVSTVIHYGLMGAESDGMFRPQASASIADGSRVMVGLLGYDQIGSMANWSSSDYYSKARTLGLLRGISTQNGVLTVRTMAKMAINLLSASVATISSVGEQVEYAIGDETYIEKEYGYSIIEGEVQAVGQQALTGIAKVNSACIKINGEIYNAGGKNYTKYLGLRVKAIVDEDADAVLAISSAGDLEELTVEAENIISYASRKFTYLDEREKEVTVSLSAGCDVILNGQTVSTYNEKDFMPLEGYVNLIDRDSDGVYDIAYITSMIYYKIGGIYADDFMSDLITGETISLHNIDMQCFKGGSVVDVSAVKTGNVVAVSPGAFDYTGGVPKVDTAKTNTLSIDVLSNMVSGTISAVSKGGILTYTIDGVSYEASPYYQALLNAGVVSAPGISDVVDFYLNMNDEIIFCDKTARFSPDNDSILYGYLLAAKKGQGLQSSISIKIVNTKAQEEILDFADKFYINDSRVAATQSDFFNHPQLYQNGELQRQLIRYELNGEGKIKVLHIAINYADEMVVDAGGSEIPNPNYKNNLTGFFGYDDSHFALMHSNPNLNWNMNIDHHYTMNDSTIVFVVPSDPDNMDAWEVTDRSYIKNEKNYPFMAYDPDEALEFGAVVVDYSKGGSASQNMIQEIYDRKIGSCMITGTERKMVDGEVITVVNGKTYNFVYMQFQNWQDVTLIPRKQDLEDVDGWGTDYTGTKFIDLQPGDVIEYDLNIDGKIERFRVLAKRSSLLNSSGNVNYGTVNNKGAMDRMHMGIGTVTKMFDNGSFMFATDAAGTFGGTRLASQNDGLLNRGMIRVFIFDEVRQTVTQTDTSALRIGDKGFLRSQQGQALDIFIYR